MYFIYNALYIKKSQSAAVKYNSNKTSTVKYKFHVKKMRAKHIRRKSIKTLDQKKGF